MAIKIGKTVYRNIQEQVEKNKEDIEGIKKTIPYPSDEYYNKDESDAKFETIADIESNYYDKNEIDTALSFKQDSLTEGDGIDINGDNMISVDTATIATKEYVTELINEIPTQKFMHYVYVKTYDSAAIIFSVILETSAAITKINAHNFIGEYSIPIICQGTNYIGNNRAWVRSVQSGHITIEFGVASPGEYLIDNEEIEYIYDSIVDM